MSGKYSRTYSRKRPQPAPHISEFDAMVTEDSEVLCNQPAPTKAARHVGKWGVTSYTSLRAINNNGESESSTSVPSESLGSSFPNGNNSPLAVNKPVNTYKRRKFFKSRATPSDEVTEISPEESSYTSSRKDSSAMDLTNSSGMTSSSNSFDALLNSRPVKEYAPPVEQSNIFVPTKKLKQPDSPPNINYSNEIEEEAPAYHPGIKLKILKSRIKESDVDFDKQGSIPSESSKSSSSSTTGSTAPSSPTSDSDHENLPLHRDITTKKTINATDVPSPVTRKSSIIDSQSIEFNHTLDSSVEFGDIIDQRTGLPSKAYGKAMNTSQNDSPFPSPAYSSTYSNRIKESPISTTNEINNRLPSINKNEENTINKSYGKAKSSAKSYGKSNTKSINESSTKSYGKTNIKSLEDSLTKSYVKTNLKSLDTTLTKSSLEKSTAIDVRNAKENVNNNETNKYYKPQLSESPASDLFSTDFDEEEIVDRTLMGNDKKSKPLEDTCSSQEEIDKILGIDSFKKESASSSSSSSLSNCDIFLKKSASLPVSSSKDNGAGESSKLGVPRKRSIFKSRVVQDGANKNRATYNHKWHSSSEDKDEFKSPQSTAANLSSQGSSSTFDDFDFDDSSPGLKRVKSLQPTQSNDLDEFEEFNGNSAVTRVKCNKEAKPYYTVIKNVKKLHQLQESGEFQEFNDDVEYFLEALSSSNSSSTRCLAALNLGQKCMTPAFRMHLRAHGTVCKFFNALQDAPKVPGLALCSAMVMFALSQDRLNMDLDRDSLELMLNLLETDSEGSSSGSIPTSTLTEAMGKTRELCRQLQKKGHAKHLNLDDIDASSLAMETLLSLTSKRAGEWFKEELRELGGIDHLVRTITTCVSNLSQEIGPWDRHLIDTSLSKIERCLKVLENVTSQNDSNQEYLLECQSSGFIGTLISMYKLLHDRVPLAHHADSTPLLSPDAKNKSPMKKESTLTELQSISNTLVTTLKVLVNLTHNSRKLGIGSKKLGAHVEIYDITLTCLLVLPEMLTQQTKFEVMVLSCCLLLNLVEHSTDNRNHLLNARDPSEPDSLSDHGAMAALVNLFYSCERSAKEHEAHTDQIIDRDLDQSNKLKKKKKEEKEEDLEETFARLLQKAGRHMEDTVIAAYTAFLTGYCVMNSDECEAILREMQPEGNFREMVSVLKKFLHFMNLTATTSLLRSLKPAERVVKHLEQLDPPLDKKNTPAVVEEEEDSDDNLPASDDIDDCFGF